VLLIGWGATIVSLESLGATRAWSAAAGASAPVPSLVIADYRLDTGDTGVAAIGVVRERFGRGIPAIVVTGSSMTGHEKEAAEHDFHVLIKPVLPNKLRAMIGFKLTPH
jgi:CheY-like chemotaxis protein